MSSAIVKVWDNGYPEGIAGYATQDALNGDDSDAIETLYGTDWGFGGQHMEPEPTHPKADDVADAKINRMIGDRVQGSKHRESRHPIVDTANDGNMWTLILSATDCFLFFPANERRRNLDVVNQGSSAVNISTTRIASSTAPNSVALAPGAGRSFRLRCGLWVYGIQGAVIDWVEEVY
jgi:hypothetical protein